MTSADPSSGPPSRGDRTLWLGILSLLALGFMLFQIALLRELRFQLTTLFTLTPFLFSIVIVCIAGGSWVAGRIRKRSREILRWSSVVLPLMVLPLFGLSMVVAQGMISRDAFRFEYGGLSGQEVADEYIRSTMAAFLGVAVLGYGAVFFLQGLLFSLYFREGKDEGTLPNVYGVDLLASGVGALIAGALNFWITPVQMVTLSSLIFLVPLWISVRYLALSWKVVAAATLGTGLLAAAEGWGGYFSRIENPGWLPGSALTVWSRYRRIDAVPEPQGLHVYTDGLRFQYHGKARNPYEKDPRLMTAHLIRKAQPAVKDVLIIGAGSGSDIRMLRQAIPDREMRIVGVELDEGFVKTAKAFPWIWDQYSTAEIRIQEGRYFLENARGEFDFVLYAYIDPQSAVGSVGVPDANLLYTAEGIRAAWARVRDGGHLEISRVFLHREEKEFIARMSATLKAAGIPKDWMKIYSGRSESSWGYYGDLSVIHVLARKGGPPMPFGDDRLTPIVPADGARASTDLFPFSLGTGIWFDTLLGYVRRHVLLLVAAAALAVALGRSMVQRPGRPTLFVLGFGSFLLESLVLFNSFLLFGDPNLSAALTVGIFLLWNGIGSMVYPKVKDCRWLYWVVPVLILAYGVTAPFIGTHSITASLPVRIAVFSLHLGLGGLVAGMMFPAAIRGFPDEPVPTLFFMDVLGCAFAPPAFWLAMSLTGVWVVIAGAGLCYAVVCVVLRFRL